MKLKDIFSVEQSVHSHVIQPMKQEHKKNGKFFFGNWIDGNRQDSGCVNSHKALAIFHTVMEWKVNNPHSRKNLSTNTQRCENNLQTPDLFNFQHSNCLIFYGQNDLLEQTKCFSFFFVTYYGTMQRSYLLLYEGIKWINHPRIRFTSPTHLSSDEKAKITSVKPIFKKENHRRNKKRKTDESRAHSESKEQKKHKQIQKMGTEKRKYWDKKFLFLETHKLNGKTLSTSDNIPFTTPVPLSMKVEKLLNRLLNLFKPHFIGGFCFSSVCVNILNNYKRYHFASCASSSRRCGEKKKTHVIKF